MDVPRDSRVCTTRPTCTTKVGLVDVPRDSRAKAGSAKAGSGLKYTLYGDRLFCYTADMARLPRTNFPNAVYHVAGQLNGTGLIIAILGKKS